MKFWFKGLVGTGAGTVPGPLSRPRAGKAVSAIGTDAVGTAYGDFINTAVAPAPAPTAAPSATVLIFVVRAAPTHLLQWVGSISKSTVYAFCARWAPRAPRQFLEGPHRDRHRESSVGSQRVARSVSIEEGCGH